MRTRRRTGSRQIPTVPTSVGGRGGRRTTPIAPLDLVPSARYGYFANLWGGGTWPDQSRWANLSALSPDSNTLAIRTAWDAYNASRDPEGHYIPYVTFTETQSYRSLTSYYNYHLATPEEKWPVPPTTWNNGLGRFRYSSTVPLEEILWWDNANPADTWSLFYSDGYTRPYYGGYDESLVVNAGVPSYQERVYQYAKEHMDYYALSGVDGLWVDNFLATTQDMFTGPSPRDGKIYKYHNGQLVVAYNNVYEWRDAMISMVQNVAGQLKADGYYIGGNCHFWEGGNSQFNTGTPIVNTYWSVIAPYMSGMLSEYAMRGPGYLTGKGNSPERGWYDYLDEWVLGFMNAGADGGCDIWIGCGDPVEQGASITSQQHIYFQGFVHTHWRYDEHDVALFWHNMEIEPWVPSTVTNFIAGRGTPFGNTLYAPNTNLRARRWTGGWSACNTDTASTLSHTFADPFLGGSRSISLPPLTGLLELN